MYCKVIPFICYSQDVEHILATVAEDTTEEDIMTTAVVIIHITLHPRIIYHTTLHPLDPLLRREERAKKGKVVLVPLAPLAPGAPGAPGAPVPLAPLAPTNAGTRNMAEVAVAAAIAVVRITLTVLENKYGIRFTNFEIYSA